MVFAHRVMSWKMKHVKKTTATTAKNKQTQKLRSDETSASSIYARLGLGENTNAYANGIVATELEFVRPIKNDMYFWWTVIWPQASAAIDTYKHRSVQFSWTKYARAIQRCRRRVNDFRYPIVDLNGGNLEWLRMLAAAAGRCLRQFKSQVFVNVCVSRLARCFNFKCVQMRWMAKIVSRATKTKMWRKEVREKKPKAN